MEITNLPWETVTDDGGTAYTIEAGGEELYSSTGIAGGGETITFSLP